MGEIVKAKLFMHGGSQAVRLPKAFRFEGTEVLIRKEGSCIVLEPDRRDFRELWAKLEMLRDSDDPFPERSPQPDWPEGVVFDE